MIIQETNFFKILIIIFLFFFLASCSTRVTNHGTIFSLEEIKKIKNTKLNKSEVVEILGLPSTMSTFSDRVWYYISNVQKEWAYFRIKTVSNNVLKITFNKNDQLTSYKFISAGKLLDVEVINAQTQANVDKEENFWQAFLSSFKRRLMDPQGLVR